MTNSHFTGSSSTATSRRSTTTAMRSAGGTPRTRCWRRWRPRAGTTPGRRCSGTTPSTPASRPVSRGCPPTPTRTTSTPPPRWPTRTRCSTTTAGSSSCGTPTRSWSTAAFELLLPDHDQLWVFTRTLGDDVLLVLANCSSEPAKVEASDVPDLGGCRRCCSARTARRARAGPVGVAGLRAVGPGRPVPRRPAEPIRDRCPTWHHGVRRASERPGAGPAPGFGPLT